jgi:predicted DNA-binding transcriptional regulator AlpA
MKDIYEQMAEKWPSAIVARREVFKFSGGLLNPRTLANLASRGEGPPQVKMGTQIVFYPVSDLVAWLRARVQGQP